MFKRLTELNESFEELTDKVLTTRIRMRRLLTTFLMPKFVTATDSLWFSIYKRKLVKHWIYTRSE